MDKNGRLADLRGKWVIVEFWALNCSACLRNNLPRLVKFYEEHQAQRDRFEVVSICVDCNGEMKSIAEVEQELAPIVEHGWGANRFRSPSCSILR